MNAESLKTELQQVLENDLVLRKEFNELKEDFTITRGVFNPWDIYSFENYISYKTSNS